VGSVITWGKGGGSEPNKTTAKKRGLHPIYSLYGSTCFVSRFAFTPMFFTALDKKSSSISTSFLNFLFLSYRDISYSPSSVIYIHIEISPAYLYSRVLKAPSSPAVG
jgi:hypothetical protein